MGSGIWILDLPLPIAGFGIAECGICDVGYEIGERSTRREADGRGHGAEGGGRLSEGRGQMTEDRRQKERGA